MRQFHLKTSLIHQPEPRSCFQTCLHSDNKVRPHAEDRRGGRFVCMGALSYNPLYVGVYV